MLRPSEARSVMTPDSNEAVTPVAPEFALIAVATDVPSSTAADVE